MTHLVRMGLALAAIVAASHSGAARGDRISLHGGGTIQGVVVADDTQPTKVLIQTATSARPLTMEKDQVVKVVREPGPLDEYLAQRDKIEPTAQTLYDFGLWCEQNRLTGPASEMFQKAVDEDSSFAPAHKKLGHIEHNGQWLTYDQRREAQGMVKVKGKWVLRSDKEKSDASAAVLAEQASWTTRLKLIRRKLETGPDTPQRQEAEAQLNAIRDPAAIPGLIQVFINDGDAMRVRIGQIVGAIPGTQATEMLVKLCLNEANGDIRNTFIEEINRRRDPLALTRLVAMLKSPNSQMVGRAALTLAGMRAVAAVPRLVEALVKAEKQMVMMPVGGGGGMNNGGFGSGGYTFAQNSSTHVGGAVPATNGAQGFSQVNSYGVITSVATAPGVVAFGSASVGLPGYGSTNFSAGGGVPQEVPTQVTVYIQNPDVLTALESLTGVNNGFDVVAWRQWVQTSFRPDPAAPRRVPVP